MAVAVADEAVKLAAHDPLPTPITVVRTLADVARRFELVPAERRLVQLAAAASARVLANARLELYPRDLDPIRALRLSQAGAGVPEDGLSPATLAARVAARFPGLDPLPDGLELSRLLRDAGFDLRWNGELLVPPTSVTSSSSRPSDLSAGHGDVRRRGARWCAGGADRPRPRPRRRPPGHLPPVALGGLSTAVGGDRRRRAGRRLGRVRRRAARGGRGATDHRFRCGAAVPTPPDADDRSRANLQRLVDAAWKRLEQRWAAAPGAAARPADPVSAATRAARQC